MPSEGEPGASTNSAAEGTQSAREHIARSQFARGYSAGWDPGCDHAFRRMLASVTHDAQMDFHVEDCYALVPADVTAVVPIDPGADALAAGMRLGQSDGCRAASVAMQRCGFVGWGDYDSLTESICR
jgi:hypothetical protein